MLTILLSAAAVVLFVLVALVTGPAHWMLPMGLACLAAAHLPWDSYLHRQP